MEEAVNEVAAQHRTMSALRMALETSVWWHIVLTTMLIICIVSLSTIFSFVLGSAPSRKRKSDGDVVFISLFIGLTIVVIVCDVITSIFAAMLCAPPYMLACACALSILTVVCSMGMCKLSVLYTTSFMYQTEEYYTAPKKHRSKKHRAKKHRAKKHHSHHPPRNKHSTVKQHHSKPKKRHIATYHRPSRTRVLQHTTARDTKFTTKIQSPTHVSQGEAVRRAIAHGTLATFTGIAFVIMYNLT